MEFRAQVEYSMPTGFPDNAEPKSCLASVYLLQLSVQMLCKTLVKTSHLLLVFVRLTEQKKCLVCETQATW